MTVGELIEKLRDFPQDAEIWYVSRDSYTDTVEGIDHQPEFKRWSGADPSNAVLLL
jgi:hypothetical protein